MLTRARAKSASVAVAILVTAIVGAPAFATEQPDAGANGVAAFAKPTNKPRPSHPHATPTPPPTPAPTPLTTPPPTPKITAAPNPPPAPQATPRTTSRPRPDSATPKPSKRPEASAGEGDAGSSPPDSLAPGVNIGGAGGAGSVGPTPEVLGLATGLAAFVGLGSLWFFTRRRRRGQNESVPADMKSKVAPPAARWTNVRLDDNDALPPLLRAIAESERAPLAGGRRHFRSPVDSTASLLEDEPVLDDEPPSAYEPLSAYEPRLRDESPSSYQPPSWGSPVGFDESHLPDEPLLPDEPVLQDGSLPVYVTPARLAQVFAEPLQEGGMRLTVTADETELLDQPGESGVLLSTLIFGDEIEVQDLEDQWVRVLTPLGATGWIPAASLGVGGGEPESNAPDAPDSPSDTAEPAEPTDPTEQPEPRRRGFRLPRRSGSTRPAT
jgi:outer membrane biosynthesis protein TonB